MKELQAGDPILQPKSRRQRVMQTFPPGQMLRYLCVGAFNTLFGYVTFVVALALLNGVLPQRFLYLTVVIASAIVIPINITAAFLGYKYIVFRSKGNFFHEWLRCFAMYGAGWVPGLFLLSLTTRLMQSVFHRYRLPLHAAATAFETHLTGLPLRWAQHAANGKASAGYAAGLIVVLITTIYSFMGHKLVTFRRSDRGEGRV
jgi:putative flippase GtrA